MGTCCGRFCPSKWDWLPACLGTSMGKSYRDWHRLFGLILTDFFTGSPFHVELEKDLSLKKQLLDVVVLRKGPGRFTGRLPDGLDNLATHNLITFKSHQE